MNNKLDQLLVDSFFVLWLRGGCSAEEQKQWNRWLQESPEHQGLVREAEEIVIVMGREYDIPDSQNELRESEWSYRSIREPPKTKIFTFLSDNQPYCRSLDGEQLQQS